MNPYLYCGNSPMMYVDPDGEFIIPLLGALVSGMINMTMRYWNGDGRVFQNFFKGFAVGLVGSGLGAIGGPGLSFMANLGVGAAEGAVTSGFSAILHGESIKNAMLGGATSGMIFATLTSANLKNLFKGEGFNSNTKVFENMMARKMDKQSILDYFGFKGKYEPWNRLYYHPDARDAYAFTVNDQIYFKDAAFESSYDVLHYLAEHESFHRDSFLKGDVRYSNNKLDNVKILNIDEYNAYFKNYKRLGFYPSADMQLGNVRTFDRLNDYGWRIFRSNLLNTNALDGLARFQFPSHVNNNLTFQKKWYDFIFKIPRRY